MSNFLRGVLLAAAVAHAAAARQQQPRGVTITTVVDKVGTPLKYDTVEDGPEISAPLCVRARCARWRARALSARASSVASRARGARRGALSLRASRGAQVRRRRREDGVGR